MVGANYSWQITGVCFREDQRVRMWYRSTNWWKHTHTHTQHSQKHIDNAYSVVWGHAWQSLNNFNEPYLVRIGKRSPHRAAFIKQTSPRQIFKTDSLAVFFEEPLFPLPSQHQKCKEQVLDPCTSMVTVLWMLDFVLNFAQMTHLERSTLAVQHKNQTGNWTHNWF